MGISSAIAQQRRERNDDGVPSYRQPRYLHARRLVRPVGLRRRLAARRRARRCSPDGGREVNSTRDRFWAGEIVAFILLVCLTACAKIAPPISESDYATNIVGLWQGTVGSSKETMSLDKNGTFVCQLQPTGFISTMIFPTKGGSIRGTWKVTGTAITLDITGEKNERLENNTASSTIVSFKEDELVLKSDRGGTAAFERVRNM
jgi:hypothetical protein